MFNRFRCPFLFVLPILTHFSHRFLWYRTIPLALVGHVGGVALFTLIINGALAGPLLKKLGLAESTSLRKRVVEHFRMMTKDFVLGKLVLILTDPRFKNVDFSVVSHHAPILRDLTIDELEAAIEKYASCTPAAQYKEPNLVNIVPYLCKSTSDEEQPRPQKRTSQVLEDIIDMSKTHAASFNGPDCVHFKGLSSIYNSVAPGETNENKDGDSSTSQLISAASNGDLERVKELLSIPEIDVNKGDYDMRCPLHLAAAAGDGEKHIEVVKLLVNHGADVNIEDRWGGRPLDEALRSNHTEVADLLRRYKALPGKHTEGNSDLIEAAASGNLDEVKQLLSMESSDVNKGDYDGRCPLHLAVSCHFLQSSSLCFMFGCCSYDHSPQSLQAAIGHVAVVKLLCENGASVSAQDRWGKTALDDAVSNGHTEAADVIRRYGKRNTIAKASGTIDLGGSKERAIELRHIFIETLREAYNEQVDRGELDGRSLLDNVLFNSLDTAALNASEGKPLSDWEATNASAFNDYMKNAVQAAYSFEFWKAGDKNSLEHVQLQLGIRRCLAFLSAHYLAQERFRHEFTSSNLDADVKEFSAAKDLVLEESAAEVDKARSFLDSHDPKDISVVVSHLVCLILLNMEAKHSKHLSNAGFLKPKEAQTFINQCDHEIINVKRCSQFDHGELSKEDKHEALTGVSGSFRMNNI